MIKGLMPGLTHASEPTTTKIIRHSDAGSRVENDLVRRIAG